MKESFETDQAGAEQTGSWERVLVFLQDGFRSQREAFAFLAFFLFVWLLAVGWLSDRLESSLGVLGVSVLLSVALTGIGGFVWAVWGRKAFPLPEGNGTPRLYGDPGSPYRSGREFLTLMLSVGVVVGVANNIAESSRSIVVAVFMPLGIILLFGLIWQAWIKRGRQRFPSKNQETKPESVPPTVPLTRMDSVAGKLVFWGCTIPMFVFFYLIQWLEWPSLVVVPAALFVMVFVIWLSWVMSRPLTPSTPAEPAHAEQSGQEFS